MRGYRELRKVCDGCWKRGRCESLICKCSCNDPEGGWTHVDNPVISEEYPIDPNEEY